MRLVLFSGKGGVGKTTIAAATASLAAARGAKTLILSADPAHSLAEAFGAPLGPAPTELDAGLYGMQVDAQRGFERSWRAVGDHLGAALEAAGVDPLEAEELTVLPGIGELVALSAVAEQARAWDLVVVDCAPTGETLHLLALPEVLGFYGRRLAPLAGRLLPGLLRRTGGPDAPGERLWEAAAGLAARLAEVRGVLAGDGASVRLVLTPEAVVLAEARRAFTALHLHGYRVDGVVANRVFPDDGADEWRRGWVAAQQAQLRAARESFAPLPVRVSPYRAGEPVGVAELHSLAETVYGDSDPVGPVSVDEPFAVSREGGQFTLSLSLPLARREELELARSGDELVVTAAGARRVLTLPAVLRRCEVTGAALADGWLRVAFRPDPGQWPERDPYRVFG